MKIGSGNNKVDRPIDSSSVETSSRKTSGSYLNRENYSHFVSKLMNATIPKATSRFRKPGWRRMVNGLFTKDLTERMR